MERVYDMGMIKTKCGWMGEREDAALLFTPHLFSILALSLTVLLINQTSNDS